MEESYNNLYIYTQQKFSRNSIWSIEISMESNLLYKPNKVVKIVTCCVMLQNIRLARNFRKHYDDADNMQDGDKERNDIQNINFIRGEAVRLQIIQNRFMY